jgi:hypothetical protein
LTATLLLRLDERLELLDRRLGEQEALLERFRKTLGMPERSAACAPPLRRSPTISLAARYVLATFGRLIVAGVMTVLALAVVAAALRLITR